MPINNHWSIKRGIEFTPFLQISLLNFRATYPSTEPHSAVCISVLSFPPSSLKNKLYAQRWSFKKTTGKICFFIFLGCIWHLHEYLGQISSGLPSTIQRQHQNLHSDWSNCLFVTAAHQPCATGEVSVPGPNHRSLLNGSLQCPEIIPNTK